ncbi:MAG: hypothetical protein R3B72_25110 [Polyangiaceae bacterium]
MLVSWRAGGVVGVAAWIAVIATSSCLLDRTGGLTPSEGGAAGVGGQGGDTIGCERPSDCGVDTTCATMQCNEGRCEQAFAAIGKVCATGYCDGQGDCVPCTSDAHCSPTTCSGGVQHGAQTCNPTTHQCTEDPSEKDCGNYVCNSDGTCFESCQDATACKAGNHCDPNGICVPPSEGGAPCEQPTDCLSQLCNDLGVCCNDGCPFALGCKDDGSCYACNETPAPPSTCPAGCDDCDMGTCVLQCLGNACGATVTCPMGAPCRVECIDADSCKNATIQCPAGFRCDVRCSDVNHACQGTAVTCDPDAPCRMECQGSGNTCDGAELQCGKNACQRDCTSPGKPTLIGSNNACNTDATDCSN